MAFNPNKIRLFVEAPLEVGADVSLSPSQAHYLRNVMRLNEGDSLHLFNGRDGEWSVILSSLGKKSAVARAETQVREQSYPAGLTLCFAPIKGARLDFIAQKATELGVSVLQPVITERTIVRRVNTGRLKSNATEAAEQCECLWVPDVRDPVSLPQLMANWLDNTGLLFCDEAGQGSALAALSENAQSREAWCVLVGPEGGFTEQERNLVLGQPQTLAVGLGPRIMRADTAALASLTLLQAISGDWHHGPRQA